ncbi:ADP-ribosylation factor like protein 2a [Giardia muris]|uniref:ADP-ribosylation factor like protein 2a n=1 Tax=Giardia muris TaxID=5742 RepID=A0A4Z1SMC2_GIAMU|nr:ADP-ribosylation factor like protein 2a [Giardia muris]|eukprot:TNJ26720.1 ADP-ribosylation factor like protein 2a [Giardia muris]
MGLFSLIRKHRKKGKSLQLLILGLDNAGKTTILRKLCAEDVTTTMPTQGFNAKTIKGPKGVSLNCWDVGGQRAIRTYWENYYSGTSCLIWVVDSGDFKRLEEVALELSLAVEDARLAGVPVLIYANKQDLATALSPSELCDKVGLWALRDRVWHIQGCSALTGEGLEEGIKWVLSKVSK